MADKIDLNTASTGEIVKANIPHMSSERAQALVDYRDENGPFEDWEEVKKVPGFNEEIVKSLQQRAEITPLEDEQV